MFSSDQILQISGNLSHDDLQKALAFAVDYYDSNPTHICYQITEQGKYCIGWAPAGKPERGWSKYPFDYDTEIVSKIITQHLEKTPVKYGGGDGGYDKGFLMKVIGHSNYDSDVENPSYGIVSFEPTTVFYHK